MTNTTLFADGVIEASINFGVARIHLGQTGTDGKPQPCGQLVVPVVQLPALAKSLHTLLQQFEAKMVQAQQAQQQERAPEGGEAPQQPQQPVPGSFRFSG